MQITYVEYYKKQYNIEIRDLNQPLLLSRVHVKNKYKETEQVKAISIVPEICYVCGMNDEDRNDKNVVKEVRRYTYTTPAQKFKALSAFISRTTGMDSIDIYIYILGCIIVICCKYFRDSGS